MSSPLEPLLRKQKLQENRREKLHRPMDAVREIS